MGDDVATPALIPPPPSPLPPTLDSLERQRALCEDGKLSEYILQRELGYYQCTASRQVARRQYVNIRPTETLYEQEIPACLKRFSPCGKVGLSFHMSLLDST